MKNGNKIKYIVFWIFILSLFIPMIQKKFKVVHERLLEGYFQTESFPDFSDSLFKEGVFQQKFETAVSDNIGFYDFFVRCQCQLNYSLFNISKVQSVVPGKNGYIFMRNYIDAFVGNDFKGEAAIDIETEKALVVQRALKEKNIDLIFAFAPGKGSYFSEYIPDDLKRNMNVEKTNYAYYIKSCTKAGLNVIDLRKYFLSMKDTIKYPLFSQIGVHWGDYGAVLAIDTISKYIAQLRNVNMKRIVISDFEMRDTMKRGDYDAASLLNTFSLPPHFPLPYLKLKYTTSSSDIKPNMLAISDSYFACIQVTNVLDSVYSDWSYWLYNRQKSSVKDKPFDLRYEIEKRDVILIMGTDGALYRFPHGFIDQAYELYAKKDAAYNSLQLKEFRNYILTTLENINNNKKWRKSLIESAKKKGVSKEVEFFNNAKWCYDQEKLKK